VVVIASAVVPTLIAQRWFQPRLKLIDEADSAALDAETSITPVPARGR